MSVVLIDGVALETLGYVIADVPGWRDGPPRRNVTQQVPGRDGPALLVASPSVAQRTLTLDGIVLADDQATLNTRVDALKHRLGARPVHVTFADDTTRYTEAYLTDFVLGRVNEAPLFPPLGKRGWALRVTLEALQPYPVQSTETTVNFTTSPAACALGTAPSLPVITISGAATQPYSLVYKDSGGTALATWVFTQTLTSNDAMIVDLEAQTVMFDLNGTVSDGIALVTTPQFFALDPAHGNWLTSTWPTLEVTAGSGQAVYRRRWL